MAAQPEDGRMVSVIGNYFREKGYETTLRAERMVEDVRIHIDLLAEKDSEKVGIEIKESPDNMEQTIIELMRYSPFVNALYLAYPDTDKGRTAITSCEGILRRFEIGILLVNLKKATVEELMGSRVLSAKEKPKIQEKRIRDTLGSDFYNRIKGKVKMSDMESIVSIVSEKTRKVESMKQFQRAMYDEVLLGGVFAGGLLLLVTSLFELFGIDPLLRVLISLAVIILPLIPWIMKVR